MLRFIRNNYIYILVIFTIFFDELFFAVLLMKGIYAETGIKQYEAILFALLVYPVIIITILRNKISIRGWRILIFLLLILVLYLLTSIFYGSPTTNYYTFLLVYGSECVPAACLGILFANSNNQNRVNRFLPFVVFPSELLIGTVGLRAALAGSIVRIGSDESEGLNYQIISYFMVFAYTYSCYMLFFAKYKKTIRTKLLRIVCLLFALFGAVACLMGGGRGAFLLLILVSVFMLYYYIKTVGLSPIKLILLLIVFAFIAIGLSSYLGIMQSAGMDRILSRMSDAGERAELYEAAFDAFMSSPILGNGVGSVWWKVGFYSHNMLLDFLVEVGIVGALFFVVFLGRIFHKLYKLSKESDVCFLLTLIFICTLVQGTFSGYWIGQMKLFFVCSFVYVKMCQKRSALIR